MGRNRRKKKEVMEECGMISYEGVGKVGGVWKELADEGEDDEEEQQKR